MDDSVFYKREKTAEEKQAYLQSPEYQAHLKREEALRERINAGLAYHIRSAKGRTAPGGCFTYTATDTAFTGLTNGDPNGFYDVPKIFEGRDPADQMIALQARTGKMLEGDDVTIKNIRPGMVLGIASNDKPGTGVGDVRRTGVVYKDPASGQMMFTESTKDGRVVQTPLRKLLANAETHHKKLFAADLVTLAESMGAQPRENFRYSAARKHGASKFAPATTNAASESESLSALRSEISAGIEEYTEDAIRRGVKYGMGVRDGKTRIDCSGLVFKAAQEGFEDLERKGKGRGRGNPVTALNNCSENQIDAIFKKTGNMLENDEVSVKNLREGMVIGLDTGKKSWDGGRKRGIDHIAAIYRDKETGKLMVAESAGCVGARRTELGKWLKAMHKRFDRRGLDLYAVDLAEFAEKSGLQAEPEAPKTRYAAVQPRSGAPAM
jgi:hypothetical protein